MIIEASGPRLANQRARSREEAMSGNKPAPSEAGCTPLKPI
jgi:hypothetical protein